ncbi:hypothetical protein [Gordonia westfalica]|uniref:hypothetical protein n=1 Tax=Gordonia westfalica TaxID=158898 RepID=UPI001AD7FD28|nr:hypothetical protein [Gordonia westfalica]
MAAFSAAVARQPGDEDLVILGGAADPNGIDVGSNTDSDVVAAAQRIWRDNRIKGVVAKEATHHMLNYATSYMTAWVGTMGTPSSRRTHRK